MTNKRLWPSLEYEDLVWESTAAAYGVDAEFSLPGQRYKAAIPPLIARQEITLRDDTVRYADQASMELIRFDQELGSMISNLAPMLLRSESASSSQIENLSASARAIFSAELGVTKSRNAEMIASNTKAMEAAISLAEDVSSNSILKMHSVLMASQAINQAGQWREEAVWIGTSNRSPKGAYYVAPHYARIPELIEDLVDFLKRKDIPALAQVALAHAQFETIHPFTDGNGRTGRALAQSTLRHRGVTRHVAMPVSAGLLADIDGYHQALKSYRLGQPDDIVQAFSAASLRAIANTRQLVDEILEIRESWNQKFSARKSSNAWAILDLLMNRPVVTAAAAAEALGVKAPNIYPPLRALAEAGILQSKNEHKLGPFWRSDEILHAIDRFAQRAGRRSKS